MSNEIDITSAMFMKDVFTTSQIKSMVSDECRTICEKRTSPKGVEYNLMVSKLGEDEYAVWTSKSGIKMRPKANFFYRNGRWVIPSKNHHIAIID